MSRIACSIPEAVERLSRRDSTLTVIDLFNKQHTDTEVAELADCLLAHPDVVTHVYLSANRLTDETGVKLARYVAASSTIQCLNLRFNQFGSATYLALAAALCVNTSLQCLYLCDNHAVNSARVDTAFIDALILNPVRPTESYWGLYSWNNDFDRLKRTAEELGHPSMQASLAMLAITI